MEEAKKVLQMTFATTGGGTIRISVGDTADDLTPTKINEAMDAIVAANVFEAKTGEIMGKAKARYVTQEIENVEME